MSSSVWTIERRRSTAGDFHALPIPDPATPQLWVHEITRPALVLGSTQSLDVVDHAACARRGVEVVRRRSGGGAVLLDPGAVCWIDVILPAGAPGWSHDVHQPMVWLGRHLVNAFAEVGMSDVSVHDAAMVSTEHSRLICFDGVGPGELVSSTGSKIVGISQRRTRAAARMQCCWYIDHDHSDLTTLLLDAPDPSLLRPVTEVEENHALWVVDSLLIALNR